MAKKLDKKLVLQNGEELLGSSFGGDSIRVCELVYNTSMFAYQDALCDPSSAGLMLLMTYPVIGSLGILCEKESLRPTIGGLIVREYNDLPSNFCSKGTLSELLRQNGVPAIEGVDTRRLTRMLRDNGTMSAVITDADMPKEQAMALIEKGAERPLLEDYAGKSKRQLGETENGTPIALIDCGAKAGIAESFASRGFAVGVFPWNETAEEIMAQKPRGVVVAGGAGDPRDAAAVIETVGKLAGRLPLLGVGLGADIVALAVGARVERLKAGHRGGNRPMRYSDGTIKVSGRNFGFGFVEDSLEPAGLDIFCRDAIDGTVCAVVNREKRIFAAKYYPELTVGVQDSDGLCDGFFSAIREGEHNA